MLRKVAAASLVLSLGLICALMLAEGALRLVPPAGKLVFDRPSHLIAPAIPHQVRHHDPIPAKTPGHYRIFVLGDSFTWGTNVMANATYASHLGWLLSRTATRPFEVFNYGVAGSCTADQIELLETLREHQPDLVLIGYFLNDPDPGRRTPQRISSLIERLEHPPGWERRLRRRSRLAATVLRGIWSARLVDAQIRYFHDIHHPATAMRQRHAHELEYLANLSRELGIDVRMLVWPHLGFPLDHRYPFRAIHERLRNELEAFGIPHLDLLETFAGIPHERLEAVPKLDPHPNEIAHRMAGDAAFAWLRRTTPHIERAIRAHRLTPNRPIPSVRMRLAPLDLS